MLIPILSGLFSKRSSSLSLSRRKGGGGGGRGGAHPAESGPGSSSGGKSNSHPTGVSIPLSGSGKSATTYGSGGGKPKRIPQGSPFSGQYAGGGTRGEVFGSPIYGSGYPSTYGAGGVGVSRRGFPYYYWPVVWPGDPYGPAGAYLYETDEYGDPTNSSRPGGAMAEATFASHTSTFHILSDNSTVVALITTVVSNCSNYLAVLYPTAFQFNGSAANAPKPEQAVWYYRASTVVLTLDGYNNSATLNNGTGPNTPLPTGVDINLLVCLNQTIGLSVPLVNGGTSSWAGPGTSALGIFWVLWFVLGNVI